MAISVSERGRRVDDDTVRTGGPVSWSSLENPGAATVRLADFANGINGTIGIRLLQEMK